MPPVPRMAALRVLLPFERERFKAALSVRLKADEMIHDQLSRAGQAWPPADRALMTQLVYGVLRHSLQLDWLLWCQTHSPVFPVDWEQQGVLKALKSFDPKVRCLLKMGLYQLAFLDHIPDYAAIDTTVTLARKQKVPAKAVAFINGVLRGFLVSRQTPAIQQVIQNPYLYQLWPSAWLCALEKTYSTDELTAMAQAVVQGPPVPSLRVNTLKISPTAYQEVLTAQGIRFELLPHLPEMLLLPELKGSPTELPRFAEGWVYMQDVSSAQVAHWVNPQPGEWILDACAAPGSKTTHMAALASNKCRIMALEPSAHRIHRLEANLSRLGVEGVTIAAVSAETFAAPDADGFDRILVDAPCSGTGTLRRHPDILVQWRPTSSESDEASSPGSQPYAIQQRSILDAVAPKVKPGGCLVYSTCSIDPAENRAVIDGFLAAHPGFILAEDTQRLITQAQDGFYLCRLLKKLS